MPTWLLGPWGYLVAGGACLALGGYAGYTFEAVRYDDLVISQKNAVIQAQQLGAANQKVQDIINQEAAVREAKAQQALEDKNNATVQHIPIYVKDTAHCITFGLVRVLDAAATNRDPSELDATGKPNDACAPVTNTNLAAAVAINYGLSNQNSEQLDALTATIRLKHEASLKAMDDAKQSWWQRNVGWP